MKSTLSILVILFFLTVLLLSGCVFPSCRQEGGYVIESYGRDVYDHYPGSCGLDVHLLPDTGFLARYPNISEYYHFISKFDHFYSILAPESIIVMIEYETDVYNIAKEYCLSHLEVLDIGVPDYKGYSFLENITYAKAAGLIKENGSLHSFPHDFCLFGYNDQNHTLVFVGHCSIVYWAADKDKVINNWNSFVEEYYPELSADNKNGTGDGTKPLKNRGFCAKTLPIPGHLCHSKRKDFKMVPKWCRKSACEGGNSLQIYRNSGKLCLEGNASQAPASGSG